MAIDDPGGGAGAAAAGAALGLAPDAVLQLFEGEPDVAGIQLFACADSARESLGEALRADDASLEYRAITPTPLWADGWLEEPYRGDASATRFEVAATAGALSELTLAATALRAAPIRFRLARAGSPIVGDERWGGAPVDGGMRLRRVRLRLPSQGLDLRADEPEGWWPGDVLEGADDPRAVLTVSRATLLALRRGHPWILADDETSDVSRLRPGTLVDVADARGRPAGCARIEGPGSVTARVWSRSSQRRGEISVEARVAAALARRSKLLRDGVTDAVRLVHGEADGLPGLAIDRLGPLLRVLLTGRACERLVDRALYALLHQIADLLGADPPVVRVVHLADPPPGRLRVVQALRGSPLEVLDSDGMLVVREGALSFRIDPGLSQPYRSRPGTGLFLDQRDNRARIARAAKGGRWLNLFCHTGAFSVAALSGGAREVVSVDLSAPYLAALDDNVARNGLAGERHRGVRMDARRYLARSTGEQCFDGIVLDPPTAARAGRRFWSVRRDGGALVAACLTRLRPGGVLLACRNDRGSRGSLARLLPEVAAEVGVELARVEDAPPASDFPSLPAFPEGDAFEGVMATRRA